jgi:hypothetical protein
MTNKYLAFLDTIKSLKWVYWGSTIRTTAGECPICAYVNIVKQYPMIVHNFWVVPALRDLYDDTFTWSQDDWDEVSRFTCAVDTDGPLNRTNITVEERDAIRREIIKVLKPKHVEQ